VSGLRLEREVAGEPRENVLVVTLLLRGGCSVTASTGANRMGRLKHNSPNHFTTKKLADNQYEHTWQHCVNCIKVQGAVRILKTASIPAAKTTEHLTIREGLRDDEQRKFTAQIPARGGIQHSFVTHDMSFEGDKGNHVKGMGKRSANEDEGVGEGAFSTHIF